MGTTATVALVDEQTGTMTLAHVGDSRAYRYRDGELEQLTTDHSLVAELVRTGRLTEAEAAVHPHRSVITRALGTEADVEVDTRTLDSLQAMSCSSARTASARWCATTRSPACSRAQAAIRTSPPRPSSRRRTPPVGTTTSRWCCSRSSKGSPRPQPPPPPDELDAVSVGPDDVTSEAVLDDVRRHGAGKGSRWPALLFVLAILAAAPS